MIERTSKIEFVRAGLSRYPDARETVDYFETTVMEAIFAAFEAKTIWQHFRPLRNAEGSLESGKATGPVARFINAYIAGALPNRNEGKEKVWLSLGLFWRPPRRPSADVVASSSCWFDRGGGPVPRVDLPSRDSRVAIGPLYKRGERRLILEPREDFDPAEAFALLLDSMDDALVSDGGVSGTSEAAP